MSGPIYDWTIPPPTPVDRILFAALYVVQIPIVLGALAVTWPWMVYYGLKKRREKKKRS